MSFFLCTDVQTDLTRRSFFETTAGGFAGLALGEPRAPEAAAMPTPLPTRVRVASMVALSRSAVAKKSLSQRLASAKLTIETTRAPPAALASVREP